MKTIWKCLLLCLSVVSFSTAQVPFGYLRKSVQIGGNSQPAEYLVKKSGAFYLLNGDIIVADDMPRKASYTRPGGGGQSFIWPKGPIPIKVDQSIFDNGLESWVYVGLQNLIDQTRARFVPYTNQQDYITVMFTPDENIGGASAVGKQGGEQFFVLSKAGSVGAVVHEMMHALGFWHEQSRYDRDNYVQIISSNITKGYEHNFQLEPGVASRNYDYSSIMHYRRDAFGIKDGTVERTTIQCKLPNGTWGDCSPMMGNSSSLSAGDIAGINATYFFNESVPRINFKQEYERLKYGNLLRETTNVGTAVSQANNIIPYNGVLPDGIYKIKVNRTNKHLAIEGISPDNGARLVQWDFVDQANHKFMVSRNNDGTYKIRALHSGKALNAEGASTADGTRIIQWDVVNAPNEAWKIEYHRLDNQQYYEAGWSIGSPQGSTELRLASGVTDAHNGANFVLKRSQRIDANNYEAIQTFTFEKIGELPLDRTQSQWKTNNTQKINTLKQ
ncbi:MAG: M12 family metallopeptidase [Spirosomataceae bacterium]